MQTQGGVLEALREDQHGLRAGDFHSGGVFPASGRQHVPRFAQALPRRTRRPTKRPRHFLGLLQSEYNPEFVPGMCDVVKALAGNCSSGSNIVQRRRDHPAHTDPRECRELLLARVRRRCRSKTSARACGDFSRIVPTSVNRDCSPAYREGEQPSVPTGEQIVLVTDTVGDVQTRSRMRHPRGRGRMGHAFREAASAGRGGVCRPLAPGARCAPSTRRICSNFLLRHAAAPRVRLLRLQ